ncbi:MAG: rhomboid family intramembrane serine protease [Rhizobacter sp.]|nr:rhomboid family intramembrane serine protease [Ferruginibacter sp.]
MEFSETPITLLLIAANVIFSFIGFSNTGLVNKTIGWPYYSKREKQYYRFITSGFLHADWMHLIFNMFTLYFFGSNLELYLKTFDLGGGAAYLALYFLGLIAADIPSYLKHKDDPNYRSLGASGAVSAVVFAVIIFSPWSSVYLYGALKISMAVYAVLYIIYCVYMGKQNNDNVNHDAHLWGSLFGLVFTLGLLIVMKPGIMDAIVAELTNFSLFGRREPGKVLEYLVLGR